MDKTAKQALLRLISNEQLGPAIESLLDQLPDGHPARLRTQQLRRRYAQHQEHVEMGTLNEQDVVRSVRRIAGGLRDVIREYDPEAEARAARAASKERDFVLDLSEDKPPEPEPTVDPELGFFGEPDFKGSPTAQSATITLAKSYGASYHLCREAVRHAGMQMESGDRAGGRLEASMAPTGTGSYGEKALFWVMPVNGRETKVHVVVDSQLPTLTFDFGRHKTKLGQVASFLRQA